MRVKTELKGQEEDMEVVVVKEKKRKGAGG
jgi:hypothetical protein